MNRTEILDAIETLSHSQGFYGRIYEQLTDGSDTAEKALAELESMNFKDTVDLVLFLEG